LPSAWPEGAVRGVRARGGIERDLAWAGASPQRPSLRGRPGEAVQLRYRARAWTVRLDGQGRARVDRFTA
jgi:alpha-L-fucosidase 2